MITPESRLRDFPTVAGTTYLNTAAEGIPPVTVGEALDTYFQDKQRGMRGREANFAVANQCRQIAARLVHFQPTEVAFCSSSAEAYNLLLSALRLQAGEEVVLNDLDFPSGTTAWLSACAPSQVHLWKSRGGALLTEDLIPLLNPKTRLVQTSLVSFYNGFRLHWGSFHGAVRAYAPAAVLAVDITQALGRIELDCAGADCLVASTYKWTLGLHGGCVVAIPQAQAERLTSRAGGWNHLQNAFAPDRFETVVPKGGAASFEVGMPNFAAIYGLNAGLRYLDAIGVSRIAHHADGLMDQLHHGLRKLGLQPMAPFEPAHCSGIASFQHDNSAAIHDQLQARDIQIMHHAGRLRVSIHGYNTHSDVENFLSALDEILIGLG